MSAIEEISQERRNAPASGFRSRAKSVLLSLCHVTYRVPAEAGVLLTFDDGPDPEVTPRVLDLLSEHDAKAVFFVVGNRIPRAPAMLARIVNEGHLLGNHTFQHPLDGIPAFYEYYRDIKECQAAIRESVGIEAELFRPPLGALTAGSLIAPKLIGLRTMLWSVDVADWKLRDPEEATKLGEQLGNECTPGNVVLLHDDNPCVVQMLQATLLRMADRGVKPLNRLNLIGA